MNKKVTCTQPKIAKNFNLRNAANPPGNGKSGNLRAASTEAVGEDPPGKVPGAVDTEVRGWGAGGK